MNTRLKELRSALGITLEEFGRKVGITRSAVGRLEKGERNLTEQMILSICREFDVNENWLRTGEGEMFEQLTERQKAMKYTAKLLKDANSTVSNAIINFIITYEQLDDTSKKVLEDVATKYLENIKKGQ